MPSMYQVSRETIDKYGPQPTTSREALDHTLAVFRDYPDDQVVAKATVYGDGW